LPLFFLKVCFNNNFSKDLKFIIKKLSPNRLPQMPSVSQEIQVHPNPPQLRSNYSLPSVVIHGASSSNNPTVTNMSPKSKKKKKKSKGDDPAPAARSQSFHVRTPVNIPVLKLPDDHNDDGRPPPIHIEAATSDEGEVEDIENKAANIHKKRRKSLVNLLFSSSSSSSPPATSHKSSDICSNSLDPGMTPHGQRLHFRRLSEIICRLGGSKDEEKQSLSKQTSRDDSELGTIDSPSAGGGLTLRQLFPYRRRRSSVSHLDNTDQVQFQKHFHK